jgi:hypothetical protein
MLIATILLWINSVTRMILKFYLLKLIQNILKCLKWNVKMGLWVMVFNATFNNISVISLQSVLLVEETGVPRENHRPAASHWQALSHNVVSSTPRLSGIQNSQRVKTYILKFLFVNLYIYMFMYKRMKSISYICTSVRQILANKKLFCVFKLWPKEALISYDFDQKNYMFWKLVNSFKMMK